MSRNNRTCTGSRSVQTDSFVKGPGRFGSSCQSKVVVARKIDVPSAAHFYSRAGSFIYGQEFPEGTGLPDSLKLFPNIGRKAETV